jgi:hypothetical protein
MICEWQALQVGDSYAYADETLTVLWKGATGVNTELTMDVRNSRGQTQTVTRRASEPINKVTPSAS